MLPKNKHVLIIDDSKTYVMYVGLLLKRMGFEISTAAGGQEGLALLRALRPDAVLLDLGMPDMNGIAVLRQIKGDRKTADIPVVVSTMDGDPATLERCLFFGCSGFLTKPVNVASLHQVMQQVLPASGGNERKFLRTPYTAKIRAEDDDGSVAEYFALSLSEGGIYLRKVDPLAVGTRLSLEIPLDDGRQLALQGVVIYRREIFEHSALIQPGMALRFTDLSSHEAVLLRQLICRLLTHDILDEQDEEIITTGE